MGVFVSVFDPLVCVCVSLYLRLDWMSSTSVATQTFEKLIKKKVDDDDDDDVMMICV